MLISVAHYLLGRRHNSRVELAVGGVGDKLFVSKEVTSTLSTFGECDDIGCTRQVPVLMGPEFASGAEAYKDSDQSTLCMV